MTIEKGGYLYQIQDYSSDTPFSIAIFRGVQFNNLKLARPKKRGNSKYLEQYKSYLPEGAIVPDDKKRLFLPSSVIKELNIKEDNPMRWWLGYHGGTGNITHIYLLPDLGVETYFKAKDDWIASHPGYPKSPHLHRYGIVIKTKPYPNGNHSGFNTLNIWPETMIIRIKGYPERFFFNIPDSFNMLYKSGNKDALDIPATYEEIKVYEAIAKELASKIDFEAYKAPDRPAFLLFYDSCRNLIFERIKYGTYYKKQYENKYKYFL